MIALALRFFAACAPEGDTDGLSDLPPQADAGRDLSVPADGEVLLDGRASFDPEGNTLQYRWAFDTVPEGSALPAREAPFGANADTSGTTTFRPDRVGVYVVRLVVSDGRHVSNPAWVVVDVLPPGQVPVADAGADPIGVVGSPTLFDGSRSYDPVGGALSYRWVLMSGPAGSSAALEGFDQPQARLTPDRPGDYTVSLWVETPIARSLPDTAVLHIDGPDLPPVANAGADASGFECQNIPLDCSASSDPEGAPLGWYWDVESAPADSAAERASFDDPTASRTTFSPDVLGEYTLSCAVHDGAQWSLPDAVSISVGPRTSNQPPVAKAGEDHTFTAYAANCVFDGTRWECDECPSMAVDLGLTYTPDGVPGEASDPDGDQIALTWIKVNDHPAVIDEPHTLFTTARLPPQPTSAIPNDLCEETEYQFRLNVTDCPGATSYDTVKLTSRCCRPQ